MRRTKLLLTLLCLWLGLMPLAAQSVTITKELELNPLASAIVMFKNQFGKWEKPDMTDTFPYAVIRMRLEGDENEVKKAKERLTLYMGQLTAVVDRNIESSNEILFLVPARRPQIYIDCGDGCEQVLLSDMQQLRSNGVYYCTVHYQQSKEVIALEEEIALLKQRLEQLESGAAKKEETQEEESNDLQFKVNGVPFTMVKVNGGIISFPDQDIDSVVLSDYFIGQTEVTQELWNAVMGYNPSEFHFTPQHPIETINWYEALEFICRLNQITGETFDFPTQAEWIHAALGGTTSTNTYSGSGDLLFLAWFDNNSSKSAQAVAKKNPNSLGLYDMTGNVAEWCYYNDKKYAIGGSWESSRSDCAILAKNKTIAENTKSSAIGLRLAMHPKRKKDDNVRIHYLADSTCVFQVGDVYFDMKYVKGGTFMMGQSEKEKPVIKNARPQHEVTLSNYYIGETEVTEQLWNEIIGSKSHNSDSLPKTGINYFDCVHFIIRLNKITGKTFSLPTEAEWEYAARGGKKSNGYQYAGSDNINHVAVCYDNTTYIRKVKTKLPNELGLYDMSGSVREWCKDKYSDYGGAVQIMSTSKSWSVPRVLRCGGFRDEVICCSVVYRSQKNPGYKMDDTGFRLVLTIDDEFAE